MMAENKRPLSITIDSPTKHINFATIKKQRTISKNNNLLQSPMVSNRNYNASGGVDTGPDRLSVLVDTARMQLISPPPEEMLRKTSRLSALFTPSLLADTGASPIDSSTHGTTAAKRKRTRPAPTSSTPSFSRDVDQDNELDIQSPQPMEATPNPKPRKQGRLYSRRPSFESPTRASFQHLGSSPVSNADASNTPSKSRKKVIIKSPHAKNPDADFIDEMPLPALALPARRAILGARSSRRSATPIPYEPPTDVFTPPREVFLNPVTKSTSKSSKRKIALASGSKSAKGKKRSFALTIVTAVKQELPDIDLSLPMPPPSPTDDPLLLSGPPEPDFSPEPTPPRKREASVQAQMEQEVDGDLPPSSPEPPLAMDDEEAVRVFNWKQNENAAPETSTDESIMHLDPDDAGISPVRLFDFNDAPSNSNGGWGDSEQEPTVAPGGMEGVDEGEGEYTGRWKMMLVRTKQDPPSSATRVRMEDWGRPISPFPKKLARLESVIREEEEREEEDEEEEVRRMSVEPSSPLTVQQEEEEEEEVRQMSVEPSSPIIVQEEEEEQEVRQLSVEFDDEELASPSDNPDLVPPQSAENPTCAHQAVSIPAPEPCRQPSPAPAIGLVVFPSIASPPEPILFSHPTELENGITSVATGPNDISGTQSPVLSEQAEDDDQSSDDCDELSLVKITSTNPRAAARAAAILKQHNYDCYTNIEVKQRHLEAKHRRKSDIEDFAKESRRRDVFSSGVAKGSSSRRRRSTLGMGVIGDRVFIPGSPAITLPELLQEAELEVRDSPQSLSHRSLILPEGGDPFKTPIVARYKAKTRPVSTWMADAEVYGGDIGEREWTKEDWKQLDACFTDERLEVGSRLAGAEESLLAPVNMVSIDDVVDKFVVSKGGLETITSFGASWSRENLLERTRALQKKQRSGHIAPPTTPYTPLSVGSNSNVLGGKERAPHMEVPDFTPLGRRAAPPRKSRPTLPQSAIVSNDPTPDQEGPIIPPTLLAPRYSHLLEEAIAISQEGSTLLPQQKSHDNFPQPEVEGTSRSSDLPSTTIGKRVKGFLFSYLPTLPKSSSTARKGPLSLQPSLPVPPIDILSKPRGPVVTPARAPLLKPKHPKELVLLHPAPQPPTISYIPRMKKPQRLVELHPPAPPPTMEPIPRPRRSSGNSVKDLVRGYEEIQAFSHDKPRLNQGWKKYADTSKRPHWKP